MGDLSLSPSALRRPGWAPIGAVLAVVLLALLVGIPLGQLFSTALDDGVGSARATLSGPGAGRAVVNTLWTS
ncbi:MAG: hypothetical protein ACXV3C_07350, partial [Actinomycetes bacterium]